VTAPELCPAILHDRPEDGERVICLPDRVHILGAWSFVCWRCLEAMLKGRADRESVRQEWEVEP
jgi:hypothetical protein